MGRTYKTMQGRTIDMDELRSRNELMPAVGNYKVNARGDEIGPGGKVIRTREQIMSEYYADNPNATPDPQAKTQEAPKADAPKPSVPAPETLKVEDTPVQAVIEDVEPETKPEPTMQNETLAKVEEKAVEGAVEAVKRARQRRGGIKDATGE